MRIQPAARQRQFYSPAASDRLAASNNGRPQPEQPFSRGVDGKFERLKKLNKHLREGDRQKQVMPASSRTTHSRRCAPAAVHQLPRCHCRSPEPGMQLAGLVS